MEIRTPPRHSADAPGRRFPRPARNPLIPVLFVAGAICAAALAALAGILITARRQARAATPEPLPLNVTQQSQLLAALNAQYPQRASTALSPLPYSVTPVELDLAAGSAILIDTATGCILYEKNADQEIPPASMTKVVEMYVVFDAVERGDVALDDVVPLPPESWAENLPADASRMNLAEGQQVTLRELLLGLAVSSANDASIAVAHYVCGTMDAFVERMNAVVEEMGLEHTRFVESSGYSEDNVTTAREFATFARNYIRRFPQALPLFHAQKELRYPLQRNLPAAQQHLGDSRARVQPSTNKLLDALPGCDGLKTGFIYESGYNISVTAQREGTRFLSVTMRGPGSTSQEGNRYRVQDNLALFTFAFTAFADYRPAGGTPHAFVVRLLGASEESCRLVPALDEALTVPFIAGGSAAEAASLVQVQADMPAAVYGGIRCGQQYGTLTYSLNGTVLRTIPLVADRDVAEGTAIQRMMGRLIRRFMAER